MYVVVLNKPNEQIITAQKRTIAFDKTETVIKLMQKTTKAPLAINNLKVIANTNTAIIFQYSKTA